MNLKNQKGGIRTNLALWLPVLAVLSYFGFAFAQSAADDPCAIYPHQSAFIAAATATQSVVVGTSGTQIYVCAVTAAGAAGTPGLTVANLQLWYGNASTATPTPCWTGGVTSAVELGVITVQGGVTTYVGGDGLTTIFGPVPAATTTPTNTTSFPSLCALTTTTQFFNGATVDYVQVKP